MKVRLKIQLLDEMGTEETFNSKPDYVDIVNLVRSIQRAEGNMDCYRNGRQQCALVNCAWRDHCLMAPGGKSSSHIGLQERKEGSDPKQKEGG